MDGRSNRDAIRMMCATNLIILLTLAVQSDAKAQNFVDRLVNALLDQTLQASTHHRAELARPMSGKSGHPVARTRGVDALHLSGYQQSLLSQEVKACMADQNVRGHAEHRLEQLKEQMRIQMLDPSFSEPMKRVAEESTAAMRDPSFQEHALHFANGMKATISDATIQEHAARVADQMKVYMADPHVQEHSRLVSEQIRVATVDPQVQEHAKRVLEEIKATTATPHAQEPMQQLADKMRLSMDDPNVQEHANRVVDRVKATIADLNVQEQATRVVEQMKAMMASQKLQERANHLAEQMRSMMAVAAQKDDKTGKMLFRQLNNVVNEHGGQLLTAAIVAAIGIFPTAAIAGDIGHGVQEATMQLAFTDQKNLAGTLFQASIVPYLTFLYFLRQDVNGLSPVAKGGFTYLLAFVVGTIVTSITSTKSFGLTLANVDWLHSDAEQLLAFTNILNVVGLKLTLDGFKSGKITQPAKPEQVEGGIGEATVFGATSALAASLIAITSFANGGELGPHSPFLGGFGNLPEGTLPFQEPVNALSLPTWVVHVSSLLEWLVAQGLVWRIALASGNPVWKGMTWAMIPTYGNAVTACTYHVFYNQIQDLVYLQSALTLVGNTAMAFAAYRIAASNGWKFSVPFLPGDDKEVADSSSEAATTTSGVVVQDANIVVSLGTAFIASILASYLVKYGGAALPFTKDAPEWLAILFIAGPVAFNAKTWNERSKLDGDFSGPL